VSTVAFHFNVSDRFDYVCRLARKAQAAGAGAVFVADADVLERIDRDLWCLSGTDFLPHCRATASPGMQAHSPLVLTSRLQEPARQGTVLVNLLATVPEGYEGFDRVIEVVGLEERERSAARARWRQYAAAGLPLTRFDARRDGVSK